ncbi:hypothetical protein NMG60_11014432 [Bertholletia excelsa]
MQEESRNVRLVSSLYAALSSGDAATVHRLLAPDIEWWFHGPPCHRHLMRRLTGAATARDESFEFVPSCVVAVGATVLAEGCAGGCVWWVHAWTVSGDGVITHLREYFNTSVAVTRLRTPGSVGPALDLPLGWLRMWPSCLSDHSTVPGLILAI